MRTRTKAEKGAALITALYFSVILLIIGLAFLTFISNDYTFAGKEQTSTAAFFLARGGMTYYIQASPALPVTLQIPGGDTHHLCLISKTPGTNDLLFQGQVTNLAGRILSQRTLFAPGGDLNQWSDLGLRRL